MKPHKKMHEPFVLDSFLFIFATCVNRILILNGKTGIFNEIVQAV